MNNRNTFAKEERISIQREIDLLFAEGVAFTAYPLRVIRVEQQPLSGVPCAILVSVPKKRFKHAVKRNRMKRLVRETYRLHKHDLTELLAKENKGLLLAFVFVGKEMVGYPEIESAMKKALSEIKKGFDERQNS